MQVRLAVASAGMCCALAQLLQSPHPSQHLPLLCHPHCPALQLLFDFVDSKGASGLDPGSYALVTQFPRRVFLPPAGSERGGSNAAGAAAAAAQQGEQQQEGPATLAAAGLSGPREVLFLEHRGGGSGGEDAAAPAAAAAAAAASMQ